MPIVCLYEQDVLVTMFPVEDFEVDFALKVISYRRVGSFSSECLSIASVEVCNNSVLKVYIRDCEEV